jgi:hypothetical protein
MATRVGLYEFAAAAAFAILTIGGTGRMEDKTDATRATTLIDYFLPKYQFVERHATTVKGNPQTVRAAIEDCDLGRSALVRTLFRVRGLPTEDTSLAGMASIGFIPLGSQARELVIGLVGRFWTLSGDIRSMAPEHFKAFDREGFAKAVTNLRVQALSLSHTRLTTETRVWCPDRDSRRRFGIYWALIRPFSGLVRIEWLRAIKRHAESDARGSVW